jgi:hypothetical protein
MPKRFKQWQVTVRHNKGWVMGAFATPIFLWMVWWLGELPGHTLQSEYDRHSPIENTIAHPHRETLISDMKTVAMVAGGAFLLLKFRIAKGNPETANLGDADLSGVDLNHAELSGADLNGADLRDANLSGADLSGADFNHANLSGADLSGANLNGADLIRANLNGANLNRTKLKYANLSGADLRYANLTRADLRYANLSQADLNCALISDANLSDANLSGALLFYVNSREVQNLEPFQLEAQPAPYLCNVALPAYAQQPGVNPNRDCDRIPYLLSARYGISLEEAQEIVYEARQHRWD